MWPVSVRTKMADPISLAVLSISSILPQKFFCMFMVVISIFPKCEISGVGGIGEDTSSFGGPE